MMTTVRMVQSTIAAMPTAREMKEKFRASREAISADTKSPRAKAVRTYRGGVRGGVREPLLTRHSPPLRLCPECSGLRKALVSLSFYFPRPDPHLHGLEDGDDACGPEAADGGQHSDGHVVMRRAPGLQQSQPWALGRRGQSGGHSWTPGGPACVGLWEGQWGKGTSHQQSCCLPAAGQLAKRFLKTRFCLRGKKKSFLTVKSA